MPLEFCIPTRRCFCKTKIPQTVLGIPLSALYRYKSSITIRIKLQRQNMLGFLYQKNMLPTLQTNNVSFINRKTDGWISENTQTRINLKGTSFSYPKYKIAKWLKNIIKIHHILYIIQFEFSFQPKNIFRVIIQ